MKLKPLWDSMLLPLVAPWSPWFRLFSGDAGGDSTAPLPASGSPQLPSLQGHVGAAPPSRSSVIYYLLRKMAVSWCSLASSLVTQKTCPTEGKASSYPPLPCLAWDPILSHLLSNQRAWWLINSSLLCIQISLVAPGPFPSSYKYSQLKKNPPQRWNGPVTKPHPRRTQAPPSWHPVQPHQCRQPSPAHTH